MSPELIGTVVTGAGVLVGVWRRVESVRRDLRGELAAFRAEVRSDLQAVNRRIDDVLLADRRGAA